MKLQTQIPLRPEEKQIDYRSKVLLLGSCFVENMGGKLEYLKFQTSINPFGIVFNPISIENLISRALSETFFSEKDIFFHNGQWRSFEVHSKLADEDKELFLSALNSKLKQLRETLSTASHIVFTYGTAWAYRFLENGKIVSNCHKVPQEHFRKELLSIAEISKSLQKSIDNISKLNPAATIITTVSPVRHIKDGFVENSLGKAHLISAIHQFLNRKSGMRNRKSFYFPSYEIMMDELRDYRFYADDLLHPSNTAVSILWEKFSSVWVSEETIETQKEIESIQTGLRHRVFNEGSEAHLLFMERLQSKIASVKSRFPHIDF